MKPETLFAAWKEFKKGKGRKPDVLSFERDLEENIFTLARELADKTYRHGGYVGFFITDPKRRHIHKATVRDRVVHHAVMAILGPLFDPTFIHNSFSCRVGKGTHKGVDALRAMLRRESGNNIKTCWVLKCDVRKFFDSIDHDVLLAILRRRIADAELMQLLENIVESYIGTQSDLFRRCGVPIGNLTSQLFANVYMNEFDQYVKHSLRVRHYARYTDDFVVVSSDRKYLESLIGPINRFLGDRLLLALHPDKVTLHKYHNGVDFLGYVVFPHHTLMRRRTKRRILKKFQCKVHDYQQGKAGKGALHSSLQSYLGIVSHANAHRFSEYLKNYFWFKVR